MDRVLGIRAPGTAQAAELNEAQIEIAVATRWKMVSAVSPSWPPSDQPLIRPSKAIWTMKNRIAHQSPLFRSCNLLMPISRRSSKQGSRPSSSLQASSLTAVKFVFDEAYDVDAGVAVPALTGFRVAALG